MAFNDTPESSFPLITQLHTLCPIYGGKLAHNPRLYGYVENTHKLDVLNVLALKNYDPFKDPRTFRVLWDKETDKATADPLSIKEFTTAYVRTIYLTNIGIHAFIDPEQHEVLVLQRFLHTITNGDIGLVVPRVRIDRSSVGRTGPSYNERLEVF